MRVVAALGVAAFAAACGGIHEGSSDPEPDGGTQPGYTGVWSVTGGTLWAEIGQELRFLELDADGGGQLHARYASGALGCGMTLFHARLSDDIVSVDLRPLGLRSYRYQMADADTLVLSDPDDVSLELARVTEVPGEARCIDLTEAGPPVEIAGEMLPNYWSGLATPSEETFWFEGEDELIQRLDPTDGTLGAPIAASGQYEDIQVAVDGDYWAHCACGGSQDIKRYTPGNATEHETIDTVADLADEIGVRAVAWDGTSLWLAGYSYDGDGGRVLQVGGSPGARTLDSAFQFDPGIKSLAARDAELWALLDTSPGASLARIDPTTAKAIGTYQLPPGTQWQGLGAIGGSFYLLGTTADSKGVLLRIDGVE